MPLDLNISHYIFNNKDYKIQSDEKELFQTLLTNQPNKFIGVVKEKRPVLGYEFYGGNEYPITEIYKTRKGKKIGGKIKVAKTFSEFAGHLDEEREYVEGDLKPKEFKFKRLAILRMDVDNLGNIFRFALKGVGSITHYASLSRHFDYFFKGFINTIWKDEKEKDDDLKLNEYTQIIYSGGDDLFIVGKWDCIIKFAKIIKDKFKEWTCQHPSLTISGGIVLVTHKYPVIKAAEMCSLAERRAKEHKIIIEENNKEIPFQKNSITFLGMPLNWEHEFKLVESYKDKFVEKCQLEKRPLPNGFLMRVQAFHEQKKTQQRFDQTESWRWQMAYHISRLAQRLKNDDMFDFLEGIKTNVFSNRVNDKPIAKPYEFIDLLSVAARWAELELRAAKENKSES